MRAGHPTVAERSRIHQVSRHPANSIRGADHQLVPLVGKLRGLHYSLSEIGSDRIVVIQRYRKHLRAGDVRGCFRRERFRVNSDFDAALLQEPRGGHSDSARAEHRHPRSARWLHEIRCHVTGAPRQSHTAAAVPVVVHDGLAVDRFRLNAESLRTEWP